jgi:hypothetical protein
MIVEEAPMYKNQQFTKKKYVYNSSNILNKNDKKKSEFL